MGGGIPRIQGNNLLELRYCFRKLAAFRQEIAYLVDSNFKTGIDGRTFLELCQGLVRRTLLLINRTQIKVDVGLIGKELCDGLQAGQRLIESALLELTDAFIESRFEIVRAEAKSGTQS